ncbi:MAG: DNA-3-methyladenine glycosylase [Thermoflexales bacterium]|nr:DNA-3-methyladenine glycosylase [Thermoflexales bacterium]
MSQPTLAHDKRIERTFFARDTRTVAQDLLGCVLVRLLPDGTRLSGRIVETEAYRPGDAAMHAYRRRTVRNAPMFMAPGTAYVYFTYGMHFCFNISTEAEGVPAAVLIRALEPLEGVKRMRLHRGRGDIPDEALCQGPANLCKAMAIDRRLSGYDMLQPGSVLFLEVGGQTGGYLVKTSPRIGVGGDEVAKTIPWRYYFAAHPCVSGPPALRR